MYNINVHVSVYRYSTCIHVHVLTCTRVSVKVYMCFKMKNYCFQLIHVETIINYKYSLLKHNLRVDKHNQ